MGLLAAVLGSIAVWIGLVIGLIVGTTFGTLMSMSTLFIAAINPRLLRDTFADALRTYDERKIE
jgi:hypothetical protein